MYKLLCAQCTYAHGMDVTSLPHCLVMCCNLFKCVIKHTCCTNCVITLPDIIPSTNQPRQLRDDCVTSAISSCSVAAGICLRGYMKQHGSQNMIPGKYRRVGFWSGASTATGLTRLTYGQMECYSRRWHCMVAACACMSAPCLAVSQHRSGLASLHDVRSGHAGQVQRLDALSTS